MKQLKHTLTLLLFILVPVLSAGQDATTSSMSGKIVDGKGEALAGATIVAVHVPSGTMYGATANEKGLFTILGMRPGGPYNVEVSFVGFSKKTFSDVNLLLGENFVLNTGLTESSTELNEVVVTGVRQSAFNTEKMGASSNISKADMVLIPSLNRTLGDYTRLSPYATGTGSYVGREAYNTNVTVDGANFNNNFGLSGTNMPGVSGEPISMEAIEEIQVAVAPFDVRQSNFTGAGVNAITKSGSNHFRGTVYGYYRDQSFSGKKIRDTKLTVSESAKQAYGFTLGGPIIKNKLFFFLSGEKESTLTPGNTLLALDDGRDPVNDLNVSTRVPADSLQRFSQVLKDNFGYETGPYESWGGDVDKNNKILLKLDWNITKNHRLTVRYNFSESSTVSRPSNSGDARPSIANGRHSRTGGMSFENAQYFSTNKLHSITGELNSRFGGLSNKLLVAYTLYKQPRASNSSVFPFIDIMSGNAAVGDAFMSAGYELFSYKNRVDNNTLILTDNLSYQLNKHNLTVGLSYEHQYFANSYLRQGTGYYRFKNLASFERYLAQGTAGNSLPYNENSDPIAFAYTYPINGFTNPVAELAFGQFSAYAQDEYSVLDNLKITAGLRIDLPMYLDGAIDNPSVKGLEFADGETVDLSKWPDAKVLWSPRLGFSYDVFRNKTFKIRGGTGIFTGRIPFVWFTNQPTNSGMIQYQLVVNSSGGAASRAQLARLPLLADASQLLNDPTLTDIFPKANVAGGRIAAIDKNFELPQVWRTSLGFDFKLPLDMMLTLEGIYTNDINGIQFENINLQPAAGTYLAGDYTLPYWSNNTNATKYIVYSTDPANYHAYTDVVIMRNTNKGQGYSLSAQLSLPKVYGFSGMLGYSRSWNEEVTGKSGSDPFSAWQYRQITRELNSSELGLSYNNTPHRVVGSISYTIDYAKYFASSLAFFYNGYKGDAYSYIYSGDANRDGTSTHELMYIPKNQSDFIWATQADADAYFAFAAQDPYLSKHKGEFMLRNAAYAPWQDRLDMRFMQEFKIMAGQQENKLQFTVDIINFMNLLSPYWGLNKSVISTSPVVVSGRDAATGRLIVSTRKIGTDYITESFQYPSSVAGTWGIQLGLKYLFN